MKPRIVSYKRLVDRKRPSTFFWQEKFKDKSVVGIEIGVYEGHHALELLESLNIKKLYLVDPYDTCDDSYIDYNKKALRSAKRQAYKRLKPYEDKLEFLYCKSDEAIQLIKERAHFIYIDGDHSYEVVKQDLNNFYKKIYNKNYLGGHDYCMYKENNIEVQKAVDEFVSEHNLRLTIGYSRFYPKFPDWWIRKGDIR